MARTIHSTKANLKKYLNILINTIQRNKIITESNYFGSPCVFRSLITFWNVQQLINHAGKRTIQKTTMLSNICFHWWIQFRPGFVSSCCIITRKVVEVDVITKYVIDCCMRCLRCLIWVGVHSSVLKRKCP